MEMGPYLAGGVNTKTVRVKIFTPLPYAYVSAFLSNKGTPRFYFEMLYPQIVTDNRKVDCTALHSFFQVAFTMSANGTPSVLKFLTFLPAPCDPIIYNMHKRDLNFHLPLLSNTQAQSTLIISLPSLAFLHPNSNNTVRSMSRRRLTIY